jgi:hypothetical protein
MNAPAKHNHTIHQNQCHFGWNNANKPVVQAKPGETIEFHPLDASAGQITPTSVVADVPKIDFAKVNPVAGPVYVDGRGSGCSPISSRSRRCTSGNTIRSRWRRRCTGRAGAYR